MRKVDGSAADTAAENTSEARTTLKNLTISTTSIVPTLCVGMHPVTLCVTA